MLKGVEFVLEDQAGADPVNDAIQPRMIDQKLIDLDGTPDKGRIGATRSSVSLAVGQGRGGMASWSCSATSAAEHALLPVPM